mgnify:CR=1 FL=1
MGLFSRKESTTPRRTGRASSDDQLIEMRTKARHRFIGAVVLVLTAVVVIASPLSSLLVLFLLLFRLPKSNIVWPRA